MIKLFWNTHNQKKPNSNKSNDKDAMDYVWGIYHKDNSDQWIYEILNKIQFKPIRNGEDLESGDTLIVIDSSVEKKSELVNR